MLNNTGIKLSISYNINGITRDYDFYCNSYKIEIINKFLRITIFSWSGYISVHKYELNNIIEINAKTFKYEY